MATSINNLKLSDFASMVRMDDSGKFATSINKTSGVIYAGKDGKVHNVRSSLSLSKGDANQNVALRRQLLNALVDSSDNTEFLRRARGMLGLSNKGSAEAYKPLSRMVVKQLLQDARTSLQREEYSGFEIVDSKAIQDEMRASRNVAYECGEKVRKTLKTNIPEFEKMTGVKYSLSQKALAYEFKARLPKDIDLSNEETRESVERMLRKFEKINLHGASKELVDTLKLISFAAPQFKPRHISVALHLHEICKGNKSLAAILEQGGDRPKTFAKYSEAVSKVYCDNLGPLESPFTRDAKELIQRTDLQQIFAVFGIIQKLENPSFAKLTSNITVDEHKKIDEMFAELSYQSMDKESEYSKDVFLAGELDTKLNKVPLKDLNDDGWKEVPNEEWEKDHCALEAALRRYRAFEQKFAMFDFFLFDAVYQVNQTHPEYEPYIDGS